MSNSANSEARAAFDRLLAELRPKLHRYCARMSGSVIDGEDIVQEALIKALEAFPHVATLDNPKGWLFRIAHNEALDFLRRRARQTGVLSDEDPDMIVDPADAAAARQAAAASLRMFMHLPVAQRSGVILMDVLGYSLDEIGAVTGATVPAIKAALHRGRARLRELAAAPDDRPLPILTEVERAQLSRYVERFNARDFDTVRDMLAEDVRLDLVARLTLAGKTSVGTYFTRYNDNPAWQLTPALVEGRAAALVADPKTRPYFVLLAFSDGALAGIRDFRYATYAAEGAEICLLT